MCRWVLSRGSYNGVSAFPVRPTFPGGQVQIKIQAKIQLEVQVHVKIQIHSQIQTQIRDNGVFVYPMSTALLEAKCKYLLLTEVAGPARLQ